MFWSYDWSILAKVHDSSVISRVDYSLQMDLNMNMSVQFLSHPGHGSFWSLEKGNWTEEAFPIKLVQEA